MRIALSIMVCSLVFLGPNTLLAQTESPPPGATITVPTAEWETLKAKVEELSRQLEEMRQSRQQAPAQEAPQPAEEEAGALRRAAEAEAGEVAPGAAPEEEPGEVAFRSGEIGLQALNPEMSVTGDFVAGFDKPEGASERTDFDMRTLEVAYESYLDPYSRLKGIVEFNKEGAELGEAYLDRFGVSKDLNLTLGKFRQQFGVVNRWHKHALDQVNFPLALREIFGPDGLNQTGASLDWTLPTAGGAVQGLTLQVTNGSNARLFGGNTRNLPSALARYHNYRDLSKDTYLEFGLSGIIGRNDEWLVQRPGLALAPEASDLWTTVLGADLTLLWEPTEKMRYRNWVWRTEAYWLNKNLLAPDGSGKDTINAWGAYSYLQSKISRTLEYGVRADYYQPATRSYAEVDGASLSPLAVVSPGAYRWGIVPYVTWEQSPWVRYRLEYSHEDGKGMGPADDTLYLQAIFAAGPHKHEKY
jgi:hypothetical protein